MTGRLACLAVLAFVLAGCPGGDGDSDVDKDRLAAMRAEPVLKLAVGEPYAEAGFAVSGKLEAHRSKVTADLTEPAEASAARDRAVQAINELRGSGWTVFHTRCSTATFTAAAYKVADRVSYYAQIDGVELEAKVSVALQMRAPHSSESTSDLFSDRPPAVPPGRTCLETADTASTEGTPIVLDELAPRPDGPAKADGHR